MGQRSHQCSQYSIQIPAARLDDLSTGVHFCHLLHLYTNGKFSLRKVNQNAKGEVESLQNLKLMLYGMEEAKIIQTFDVAIDGYRLPILQRRTLRLYWRLFNGGTSTSPRTK